MVSLELGALAITPPLQRGDKRNARFSICRRRFTLSTKILRLIGVVLVVAAAVLAILNLKRVADLGTFWISSPLLIVGIGLIVLSRRRT